jgi:YegS/Rv2252/BmrU family lipid kinase
VTTLLVVNPAAGHGRAGRLAAPARAAVEAAFGDTRLVETGAPGDAIGLVRDAVRRGVDRILVLGGDGTLHEAANGMLTSGVAVLPPIGVVPAGTGNDFAKLTGTLGGGLHEAIRRMARGRVRRLDVGFAWDEYFFNSVGIGFDAEVAREVNHSKRGRGLPAYIAAVAQVGRRFTPFHARVITLEFDFSDVFMLLEIGIGPIVGGGFRLTPFAEPDDGLLDICAIRQLSMPGLLLRLPLAIMGKHTRLRHVRHFRTTAITVQAIEGPLVAQLDGEVRSVSATMEVRIQAGVLPVLVAR